MTKAKQPPVFEKDLEALEEIVGALEEGGLPLDDSLKKFEQGIGLYRRCQAALNAAEKRIEVLVKNAEGELEAQPFDEGQKTDEASPTEPKRRTKRSAPAQNTPQNDDAPPEPPEEYGDEEEEGDLLF